MSPRGPRSYSAATPLALYQLGKGNCYAPDCEEPTMRFIDQEPYNNAHISHIRGAKLGSARYDETMTDEQRASFANLILLCTPHHELVDTRHPENYSVELLQEWKRDREDVVDDPSALEALTDETLREMLALAMSELRPQREILLEVEGGLLIGDDLMFGPFEHMTTTVAKNQHLREEAQRYAVLTIRNTGMVRSTVESVSFYCRYDNEQASETKAAGFNHVPERNPLLPKALEVGDATHWLVPVEAFTPAWVLDTEGQRFIDFRFEIVLGSGEVQSSGRVSSSFVELAPPTAI